MAHQAPEVACLILALLRNMVTGSSDFAAMNFGMNGMPEHDLRYDMADEYIARRWSAPWPTAVVERLPGRMAACNHEIKAAMNDLYDVGRRLARKAALAMSAAV